MEKRIITINAQTRAYGEEDWPAELSGSGAVVGVTTDLGWIEEEIAPGAFESADISDVCVCFNHDLSVILGRTSAKTAVVEVDNTGNLIYKATMLDEENEAVKSAVRYVQRGEVNKSSFMFEIAEYGWADSDKYGKLMKRVIYKVGKVYECGPVTFPAYEETESSTRTAIMEARSKWVETNSTPTDHMIDENIARDLDIVRLAAERYKNY